MDKKFRRQISASSLTGGGSLPRPPQANASTTMDANELNQRTQQWEEYVRCLEDDHQELRDLFDVQRTELKAASALLAENCLKEKAVREIEAQLKNHEVFLEELVELAVHGKGLRARPCVNRDSQWQPSNPMDIAAVMDQIRDAVQKQCQRVQYLRKNDENHTTTIRVLEKELDAARSAKKPSKTEGSAAAEADGLLPLRGVGDLQKVEMQARTVERQLAVSERDVRRISADLERAQQELSVLSQSEKQQRRELQEMKDLILRKDRLIQQMEQRARAAGTEAEAKKSATTLQTSHTEAAATADTSSNAPAGSQHVTSHHYRLLIGKDLVDVWEALPGDFVRVFTECTAASLHVPPEYLRNIECRVSGSEGVAIELDVQHSYKVKGDEIDVLLLEHTYEELHTLTRVASLRKMEELRGALEVSHRELNAKAEEAEKLSKRLSQIEASQDRRDAHREDLDRGVQEALEEAETAIQTLYTTLEEKRREADSAGTELVMTQKRLAELEQSVVEMQERLDEERESMTRTEGRLRNEESRVKVLENKVAEMTASHARRDAVYAEETARIRAAFAADTLRCSTVVVDIALKLTSESMASGALGLLERGDPTVLNSLLLCQAATVTKTVPVQTVRCTCHGEARSLLLTIELGFYATTADRSEAEASIREKLSNCSFSAALDYLKYIGDATTRATEAEAAVRAHKHRLEEFEGRLQDIRSSAEKELQAVGGCLAAALSTDERHAAPTALSKAEMVVRRLRTMTNTLEHNCSDVHIITKKVNSQDELLRRQRREIAELSSAKESLVATLARTEKELAANKVAREKDTEALLERVQRVESTLQKKVAALAAIQQERHTDSPATPRGSYTTADFHCREQELSNQLSERNLEVARLRKALGRANNVAQGVAATGARGPDATASDSSTFLNDALRQSRTESASLKQQVSELLVDMEDFAKIQGSLQSSLEIAQAELRAKRQDSDVLMKQVLRMEQREQALQDEVKKLKTTRGSSSNAATSDSATDVLTVATSEHTALRNTIAVLRDTLHRARGEAGVNSVTSTAPVADASKASAESYALAKQVYSLVDRLMQQDAACSPSALHGSSAAPSTNKTDWTTCRVAATVPSGFTRTQSTPQLVDAARGSDAATSTSGSPEDATPAAFVRSATATAGTTRTRHISAAPRIGVVSPMKRQASRTYFANAAAALSSAGERTGASQVETTGNTEPRSQTPREGGHPPQRSGSITKVTTHVRRPIGASTGAVGAVVGRTGVASNAATRSAHSAATLRRSEVGGNTSTRKK